MSGGAEPTDGEMSDGMSDGRSMSGDIAVRLLDSCERYADQPALTGSDGATLSFRMLGRRIRNTAAALRERGFGPGDRMQFSIRPQPRGIVFALGAVASGGAVAFTDLGPAPAVHAARLARIRPTAVAAESLLFAADLAPLRGLARRAGIHLPGLRASRAALFHAGPRWPGLPAASTDIESLAARAGVWEPLPEPDLECLLVSTSGTTAQPKIVAHTRGSLDAALALFASAVQIAPGERVHSDQFFLGAAALAAVAHWTMPPAAAPPRRDPEGFVRALRGAQVSFLVPSDVRLAAQAIRAGAPDPGLRSIVIGAAPVTASLLDEVAHTMPGTRVLATYGMTEILPVAITDAAAKLAHTGAGLPGDYVGPALPGITAELVDGRLSLRGPSMMAGYLDESGTASAMDGFDGQRLLTTDLAQLRPAEPAEGHTDEGHIGGEEPGGEQSSGGPAIVLMGRSGDMIIRGDLNIYPGLSEPALMAEPSIGQAALIGVPDEIGDERVLAVIVPRSAAAGARSTDRTGIRDILAALHRHVAAHAQPDAVVLCSDLPTAGRSAKLDRAALRDWLLERIGADLGPAGDGSAAPTVHDLRGTA